MTEFVLFNIAVGFYVIFLAWCLMPLIARSRRRLGWLRVLDAVWLLGANVFPPFVWPIVQPAFRFDDGAARFLYAVALFPRSIPLYWSNLLTRGSTASAVVEITYPIEIGGKHYAPVVTMNCTTRRILAWEGDFHYFKNYPTASGNDLVARSGDALIVIDQSNLCSMVLRKGIPLGTPPNYRSLTGWGPTVFVIRGEAEKAQFYQLYYYDGVVSADDIVLQPPQITRVDHASRTEMSSAALWPMERRGELSMQEPRIVEAYERLPSPARDDCVVYITNPMDFPSSKVRIHRTHPSARDTSFCRDALARYIPPVTPTPLTPSE